MKGILTGREEFLYPDTELGELRQEYVFSAAANGKKGIQILLEASGEEIAGAFGGALSDESDTGRI